MAKQIVNKKNTPIKKRDSDCYQKKVRRITAWYNRLVELREDEADINPNTKSANKRKELKPLDFYISKVKKVGD
jgi:hypothetical protein